MRNHLHLLFSYKDYFNILDGIIDTFLLLFDIILFSIFDFLSEEYIFLFLFLAAKHITTNLTATIKDLEACEAYFFAVGVIGDYGAGPLNQPHTVTTHFNKRAPPKKLRVAPSPNENDSMIVSWMSSCPAVDEIISYTVSQ